MQEPITSFPMSAERKKNKLSLIVVIIIVIVAVAGWFYFIKSIANKKEEVIKITPTETQKPTLTPEPTIEKKTVKIQVLNGTGTPGQAAEAVKLIKEAGYETDNIKTGNADKFDQETTTISFKKGFDKIVDDIKNALKEKFDEIKIETIELDKDSEFDIIVTTGGKIYKEPTSTPSPTTAIQTTTTPSPTLTPTSTSTPTPTP